METLMREFSVGRMARCFGVSVSGFYKHLRRTPSRREEEDVRIGARIAAIHSEHSGLYGIDRIGPQLRKEGIRCHRRRVARLMRKHGIRGRGRPGKVPRTTDSRHDLGHSPNRVSRDFRPAGPNLLWASDITYIATRQGWLYLCVVLDLFSRRVVGWAVSADLRSEFVVAALSMAIAERGALPGLVFHSDRGVQYASAALRDVLAKHGFVQSMSRKANCLDNACAESFFATLKSEISATTFWDRDEARAEVFTYIVGYYNTRRSHSHLGYMSPEEFEKASAAA